uniref:Uncharacterized protein n=1 Tax=Dromaius novaehollandiae TaxID=8790 RepID=A0A8C4J2R3_DRONO
MPHLACLVQPLQPVDEMAIRSELKQAWQAHERSGHHGPIAAQAWDRSRGRPMLAEQPFATWQVGYVGPLPPSQGPK